VLVQYLKYPAWQLPLFAVFVFGWLLGGGYLLHRSLRGALPRRGAALGRCVLASLLAGAMVLIAAGAVFVLFQTIGDRAEVNLKRVGAAIAIVAGIPMWFLVLHAMFALPMARILGLGWPAVGGVLVLGLAVGAGAILPARTLVLRQRQRDRSVIRLQTIHDLIETNFERPLARAPRALQELVDERILSPQELRSPCNPGREIGYFYIPSRSLPRPDRTEELRACEFSHSYSDAGRVVLFRNGYCDWVPASEFERLLGLEENKEFAAAFREADKK